MPKLPRTLVCTALALGFATAALAEEKDIPAPRRALLRALAAKGDVKPAIKEEKVEEKKAEEKKSDEPPSLKPLVKSKYTSSSQQVKDAVKKIDDLVTAGYADQKLQANRLSTDEEFLRRVYMDVAGRVPTYDEAKSFLDSRNANKRQKLIDELLDSPAYVSQMYNYIADILRITGRIRGDYAGNYAAWVKEAVRSNMPWDKFVYELVASEGKSKDNGAVGYWLRDEGMVLEITAQTTQIFMGTQIGCAQCHDHPFDKWEQKEFYQLAAFTSEMSTRDRNFGGPKFRELRQKTQSGDLPRDVQQVLQNLVREESYKVDDLPKKTLKLPSDYKYDNGKPGEVIKPDVIVGKDIAPKSGESQREHFARWLTSRENPLFTQVIANRMWAKVIGLGVVHPVDDWSDQNKPSNPALLANLTDLVKTLNYDLKEYLRVVLNTRAYQLATNREDFNKDNFRNQAGVLRRMTAEQVWDSLLTIAVPDIDDRVVANAGAGPMGMMMGEDYDDLDLTKMSTDEIIKYAEKIVADRKTRTREFFRNQGGGYGQMVRASEQRQPLPGGHFLREFGASNRETVNSAHTDPSVPQALALMNGPGLPQLMDKKSELSANLAKAADEKEKANVLYLSILSRYPTPPESSLVIRELKANGAKGVENVVWALVNSREFMFVR